MSRLLSNRSPHDSATGGIPLTAPATPLNQLVGPERSFACLRLSLTGLREISQAAAATVNEVVLAICSSAIRELLIEVGALPPRPLVALVPMSLQEATGDATAGNRVCGTLCNLATHVDDPALRLRHIVGSSQQNKRLIRGLSPEAANALWLLLSSPVITAHSLGLARQSPLLFNVTISNVPGPRQPLFDNGAKLDAIYPISLLFDRQAINISVISYLDSLDFGIVVCRRAVPDPSAITRSMLAQYETLRATFLG